MNLDGECYLTVGPVSENFYRILTRRFRLDRQLRVEKWHRTAGPTEKSPEIVPGTSMYFKDLVDSVVGCH